MPSPHPHPAGEILYLASNDPGRPIRAVKIEESEGLRFGLPRTALADSGPAHVFACGPTPMMRRVAEVAEAHNQQCSVSL